MVNRIGRAGVGSSGALARTNGRTGPAARGADAGTAGARLLRGANAGAGYEIGADIGMEPGINIGEPPKMGALQPCGPHGPAPEREGTDRPHNRAGKQTNSQRRASLRMEIPPDRGDSVPRPKQQGRTLDMDGDWVGARREHPARRPG